MTILSFAPRALARAVAALVVVAAASAPQLASADALEAIKSANKIRIGFSNINPYGYVDDKGRITGQAPELLRAFFSDLGVKEIEPVVTDWGALIGGLIARRFDVISTGMLIQPKRCEVIAFGDPEYKIQSAFAVKAGNPKSLTSYRAVAASPTARLGMLTGAGDIRYAELAGIPEARRVLFPDFSAALSGLQADRVDAVVASTVTIKQALKRLNDPNIAYTDLDEPPKGEDGRPVVSYGGMGFRKEDVALRVAWNEWLAKQLASGRATQIMQPFGFGPEALPPKGLTADDVCRESK